MSSDKAENDSDSSDTSSLSDAPAPKSNNFKPSTAKLLDDGRYDCHPEDAGKVVKKIIKEGDGDLAQVGSKVKVHYTGTLLDGKKFDSSRDRGEPFSFKLGWGEVIKGWDYGVSSMKVGEVADFEIQSDYAYGDNGSPPTIPPKATLRFNVELFSFEKEPVKATEKIAFGTLRKDEGNAFVKQQKWQDALNSYDRGLAYVQYLYTKKEDLVKKKKELHEQLQANKALCCIKLNKVAEGLQACDEILKVDKTHAKAWYRRALLCEKKGDYVQAKADIQQAAQHSPNDPAIRTELEKITVHLKEYEQKEKKKYSNMFEKMKALEQKEAADKKQREAQAQAEAKAKAEAEAKAKAKAEAEAKAQAESEAKAKAEAEAKAESEKEKEKENETPAADAAAAAGVGAGEEGKAATEEEKK